MTGNPTPLELLMSLKAELRAYLAGRWKLSNHDVDEIGQEVMLRLIRKFRKNEPIDQLRAYMFQVARNVMADRYHERLPRAVALDAMHTDDECVQGRGPEEDALLAQMLQAVDALGGTDRAVVQLWYSGRSYDEIGQLLQLRPNTVRAYRERAVKRLRMKLGVPDTPKDEDR